MREPTMVRVGAAAIVVRSGNVGSITAADNIQAARLAAAVAGPV
jgi:hypothetical protein